jgi:CheY-like chemotaxis protein
MKKVLLVDDKEEVRLLVQTTLEGSDYEFYGATNGKEAVEKAVSIKPDLILLDIMMPEMDGLEACRHIKSSPETKSIPIIMLTAKGQEADIKKGKECGADDYFVKPFSPLELLKKIDEILE